MAYSVLDQNKGRFSIFNHDVREIDGTLKKEVEKFSQDKQYYEIIRCIDKVPLFFEDHLERLGKSASELKINFEVLKSDLYKLIKKEDIVNGNIKIVVTENMTIIFPSVFYYPGVGEYTNGINAGILNWERCDPNSKVVREEYKFAVAEKFKEKGSFGKYFELLLSDNNGYITEGSRSNVFFTSDNEVYTAPDDVILKGITRKYVLSSIECAGAKLSVKCFKKEEIAKIADGAFITGTSINVLPVYSIEDIVLNSSHNPLINKISHEYRKIVNDYIAKNIKNSIIN